MTMHETTALLTGASGFVGRNLGVVLRNEAGLQLIEYDVNSPPELLERGLREADVIFHLAGINRPERLEEYESGNTDFTVSLCDRLKTLGRTPLIIFSSSVQAVLDNPYGVSKRKAEEALLRFAEATGSRIVIFRLKNVFGKWCRPNYNSVVATFCNNIARDLPISISNPANVLELVYVDDVCRAMMNRAGIGDLPAGHAAISPGEVYAEVAPVYTTTLGKLADTVRSFRAFRKSLQVPALSDPFIKRLYATYLSYLEGSDFAYGLELKTDNRGSLAEFLKSPSFGQIFVSHTRPGVTRGDHYHQTKTEKFFVVQGTAIIRFRHILENRIIEHRVSGEEYRVVDIPPGYTHSIENAGDCDMVTLFWADELFDPEKPDTLYEKVIKDGGD
jgi:UDP-2-acetamido-2,6-beta-L-arabino-hexul-4-ose reductase